MNVDRLSVDIEGIVVDPDNNYPVRGIMKTTDNGVKHVYYGTTDANSEAVAAKKAAFQKTADKHGYRLIRAVTK